MQNKKIIEIIKSSQEQLKNCNFVTNPSLEAKIIVGHFTKMSDIDLIINQNKHVSKAKEDRISKAIEERVNAKPLQYITQTKNFYGFDFFVNSSVLVPRFDSEILVEHAIDYLNLHFNFEDEINIMDICCGSGCLGISIVNQMMQIGYKNVNAVLMDYSKKALIVAGKNVKKFKLQNNIKLVYHDAKDVSQDYNQFCNFNIIVCNPPYIAKKEIKNLPEDVKKEPKMALFTKDKEGLEFYSAISQNIAQNIHNNKNNQIKIFFEVGYTQAEKVSEIINEQENQTHNLIKFIQIKQDLNDKNRLVEACIRKI